MNRTNDTRRYHALTRQLSLSIDDKVALLTPYGVESSKDLTDAELHEVCEALAAQVDQRFNAPLPVRRLRSKVIDFLVSMGYYQPGGSWDRANNFLEMPRIAGKRLYLLNQDELKALVKKLASISKKKAKAQEAENQIAPWN